MKEVLLGHYGASLSMLHQRSDTYACSDFCEAIPFPEKDGGSSALISNVRFTFYIMIYDLSLKSLNARIPLTRIRVGRWAGCALGLECALVK